MTTDRPADPRARWAYLSQSERDAAYDVVAAVKTSAELSAERNAASAQARATLRSVLDLAYGPRQNAKLDLYPAALARLDLDLALAPIEQNLFNECKSNLRLLEYGACAVPLVCSDVGPYRDGSLPVTRVRNRHRDWVAAIRAHLADAGARADAGDALRAAVHRDWMLADAGLAQWQAAWLP